MIDSVCYECTALYVDSHSNPPPVTVTGVAPWAMKVAESTSVTASRSHDNVTESRFIFCLFASDSPLTLCRIYCLYAGETNELSPRELLDSYLSQCLPASSYDEITSEAEDWKLQQAALTPTLLPSLKFHDLVFGK